MALMTGGCHCGNIAVFFETDIAPEETEPRACQCSFCRQHQSRAVSDPDGNLRITVADGDLLSRYRFGLKSIDFLVCRACGVYVAGFMPDPTDDQAFATLMISALNDRARFPAPVAKDYDAQSREERTARRRKVWTPASLSIGASS